MKIYTVLHNSYDYHHFQYWSMTTTSLEEVNQYVEYVIKSDTEIKSRIPSYECTPIFFIDDIEGAVSWDSDSADKAQTHIVIMVKGV